ncbi:MAG TPA: amino acid adenylation domain-containing protein, partial [Thermoanaerobaculia bacterium]|nr:amino acid adenylation domain-containing protein [Thermoanaerobaculia bacterium]
RREAFFPCYGLAEATLLVSAGAASGAGPLAASGRPDPEARVEIVDPGTGEPCRSGSVGEIWVAGPGVAGGYWGKPEETERTFGARLPGREERWLRTGDLGFLAGGELVVTGRIKDLVILRGRNHYPQDLELTAGESHPALRPGGGAAFSVEGEGGERLVIAHEVEPRAVVDVEEVAEAVRRRVAEEHEVAVSEVVVLRAGALPRTSSGKVQRHACRAGFLVGSLDAVGRSAMVADDAEVQAALLDREALLGLAPEAREEALVADLRERAGRAMRVPASRVNPRHPLTGLGLDSLMAVELAGSVEADLGVPLPLGLLLEGATLERAAGEVLAGLATAAPAPESIPSAPEVGDHPLSHGQRGLWLEERLAPGLYNIAAAARVRGDLDREALVRALRALVERHPALRSTFPEDPDGEPVQRVHAWLEPEIKDGRDLTAEAYRPFDLANGPLVRLVLGEGTLLLAIHHLVADFWSLAVIARELGALYAGAALPLPAWSFTDHVRRQRERLAGPEGERLWDFWRERLSGDFPVLDLPADRPRPAKRSFRGGAEPLYLDTETAGRLAALAGAEGATLPMVFLAVWQTALHRWTGQEDVRAGFPAAGRRRAEVAGTVGYFVNLVVARSLFTGGPDFRAVVAAAREALPAALEHQEMPYAALAERLRPALDPSRPALVETIFAFQKSRPGDSEALAAFALDRSGARLDLGGLELESAAVGQPWIPFDFVLTLAETGEGLTGSLQYAADLFDPATARRLLGSFAALLAAAAADPGLPVSRLPLLPEAERSQVLHEWNAVGEGFPARETFACLHALIADQARRTPETVAVWHGTETLTYGALWERVEALARRLRGLGVAPEVRVGVCLERSPDLLVTLLAVLRAGGAYVPLDPAYPRERLAFMLADSGARLLVTRRRLLATLPETAAAILDLDEARGGPEVSGGPEPGPRNLAYVIYTSGSTGRPKGVAIEHGSAAALMEWARGMFADGELAAVLAATSVCFDVSVFELFAPLALGGSIVLAENALALPDLPVASRVTMVCAVPSAMAELVERSAIPPGVRVAGLGGEPFPGPLAERLHALGTLERVLNLYGPTEDTTYSTWAEVPPGGAPPLIGRVVAGTRAYILDRGGELLPVGVPGELFLGGAGLARGYLGRPELTAERFVPDPFAADGGRLYRTGDLVRWLPDGQLDYLGRLDHQVKVRGFRVELGEIEARLLEHPGVREAAVVAPGGERLVAFIASEDQGLAPILKAHLAETLPPYMVPGVLVVLAVLPHTPNGKIDRRALAAFQPAEETGGEAPRTPTEEVLAAIWAGVLGRERIGRDDDVFELGGHSLAASRVAARAREAFGVDLPLPTVFAAPTVAELARVVEEARELEAGAAPPPLRRIAWDGAPPLSFAQERLWFLDQMEPGGSAYNIAQAVRLSGRLDPSAFARGLSGIVRRH